MVIQDAVNTEHPRQYSERQGNTKIQFSKTKRPMKIFYFSSQHICLGWKIAKTVWYNFVEDDENFTHFRVLAARSNFNFFAIKIFCSCSKCMNQITKCDIRLMGEVFSSNLDVKYEMIFCKTFFAIYWIISLLSVSQFRPSSVFPNRLQKCLCCVCHFPHVSTQTSTRNCTHDTPTYPLILHTFCSLTHMVTSRNRFIGIVISLMVLANNRNFSLYMRSIHSILFSVENYSISHFCSLVRPLLTHKIQWQRVR